MIMIAMRAAAAAAGIVLLVTSITACSGSSTSPTATGTPSAVASPSLAPSKRDVAQSAALAAYRGMWADFVAAGVTSDWQSPRLGDHATGLALTNLSRGLYADQRNGLVTRGEPSFDPRASSAEPAEDPVKVVVADCGDTSNWLKYRASDGSRAGDSAGGRRAINAIVERQSDGSWKVSDFGAQAVGTC